MAEGKSRKPVPPNPGRETLQDEGVTFRPPRPRLQKLLPATQEMVDDYDRMSLNCQWPVCSPRRRPDVVPTDIERNGGEVSHRSESSPRAAETRWRSDTRARSAGSRAAEGAERAEGSESAITWHTHTTRQSGRRPLGTASDEAARAHRHDRREVRSADAPSGNRCIARPQRKVHHEAARPGRPGTRSVRPGCLPCAAQTAAGGCPLAATAECQSRRMVRALVYTNAVSRIHRFAPSAPPGPDPQLASRTSARRRVSRCDQRSAGRPPRRNPGRQLQRVGAAPAGPALPERAQISNRPEQTALVRPNSSPSAGLTQYRNGGRGEVLDRGDRGRRVGLVERGQCLRDQPEPIGRQRGRTGQLRSGVVLASLGVALARLPHRRRRGRLQPDVCGLEGSLTVRSRRMVDNSA